MDEAGVVDEAGLMDEAWGWFERAAPPCGFCSRMETASSSVGLLLAILHAHARRRPQAASPDEGLPLVVLYHPLPIALHSPIR